MDSIINQHHRQSRRFSLKRRNQLLANFSDKFRLDKIKSTVLKDPIPVYIGQIQNITKNSPQNKSVHHHYDHTYCKSHHECVVLNHDRPANSLHTPFSVSQPPIKHTTDLQFSSESSLFSSIISLTDSTNSLESALLSSSGTFKKSNSKKKVNRNASLQHMRNQPELKEHLCFYCNQYCSSVSLCQCRSCILKGNNPVESSSTADHKMDCNSKPKAVYLRPFKLNINNKQNDSHLNYSTHGFRSVDSKAETLFEPLREETELTAPEPVQRISESNITRLEPKRLKVVNSQIIPNSIFEFKPIDSQKTISSINLNQNPTTIGSRRTSCATKPKTQCSMLCINSTDQNVPIHQPASTIQRRFQSPHKRRQRNLTTSLVSTTFVAPATNPVQLSNALLRHHSRDDYLDKFLDSLEDINQYLEKKLHGRNLTEPDKEIRQINESAVTKHPSFTHTKKHRLTRQRNLTQPIFFSNEVYQMNNCKQLSTSAVDDQGQINYGQRVNSNGNRSKADLLDSSSVSNDTLRDVKTSFSSQTGVSTTVRKTDFVSLSDILSNKASSSDIKLGVGAISPPIHSKINKKNETHSLNISEVNPGTNKNLSKIQMSTPKPGFDLLTVEKLFSSLELDCDEQIKQLDECEMRRKTLDVKQRTILNEIKIKWLHQPHLFKLKKSSKTPRKKKTQGHKKQKSSTLKKSSIKKKYKVKSKCLVYLFSRHLDSTYRRQYVIYNNKQPNRYRSIKRSKNQKFHSKSSYVLILAPSHNQMPSVFCIPSRNEQGLLFEIIKIGQHRFSLEFFYHSYKNKADSARKCAVSFNNFLKDWTSKTQDLQSMPVKSKSRVERVKNVTDITLSQVEKKNLQENLLDRYYEKYCQPPPTVMRHKTNPVKSPLLENKRKAHLLVDNSYEMKNTKLNQLVCACRWLTDAGYSSIVHRILTDKEEDEKKRKVKVDVADDPALASDDCDMSQDQQTQLDATFQSIQDTQQGLQEYELNAIYKRLKILHTSSAYFNMDFKFLNDNILNIDEDSDSLEEEDEGDYGETLQLQKKHQNDLSKRQSFKLERNLQKLNIDYDLTSKEDTLSVDTTIALGTTTAVTTPASAALAMSPKDIAQTEVSMSNSKIFSDSRLIQPRRFNSFRLNDRLSKKLSDRIFNFNTTDKSNMNSQTTNSVVIGERSNASQLQQQPKLLSKSYLDISTQKGCLSNQDFILSPLSSNRSYLSKPQVGTAASYAASSTSASVHQNDLNNINNIATKTKEQPSLFSFKEAKSLVNNIRQSIRRTSYKAKAKKLPITERLNESLETLEDTAIVENKLPKIELCQLGMLNTVNLESLPVIDIELNIKSKSSSANRDTSSCSDAHTPTEKENMNFNSSADSLSDSSSTNMKLQSCTPTKTSRERCDSGVGGSLTRDIGKRREKWTSFMKSHRPSFSNKSDELNISSLSVKQYDKLRKFALVRITALLEKYSPASSSLITQKYFPWKDKLKTVSKSIRRPQKALDKQLDSLYKNKQVFGVPLQLNFQRHGRPLPQSILLLMKYIRSNSSTTVGVFRKSGSKTRMATLRAAIEQNNKSNFEEFQKCINAIYDNTVENRSPGLTSTAVASAIDQQSIGGSEFSSQSTSKSDLASNELSNESSSNNLETSNTFNGGNTEAIAIDAAEILKQYFRELPECLMTNKLSQTLIDVFTYLPESEQREAIQYCMLLLDDENRDVLQCLLCLLNDITKNSHIHKMDSRNIAICLAPTLMNLSGNFKDVPLAHNLTQVTSSTSNSSAGVTPSASQTAANSSNQLSRQCNSSLELLSLMIEQPKKIFLVPSEAYTKCQFTRSDQLEPMTINEILGFNSQPAMLNIYFQDRIEKWYKELSDKPRNWNRFRFNEQSSKEGNQQLQESLVNVSYKTLEDEDFPLRLWKLSIDLNASASNILNKLLRARAQWDEDLLESRVVEVLGAQVEIFQYAVHYMAPQPSRDFCELRCWRDGVTLAGTRFAHAVFSSSVEPTHSKVDKLGDIRANCMVNFYLIEDLVSTVEKTSSAKCRLHHIFRGDFRGYSTEWYNKIQAHILKRHLLNLEDCLKHAI